MQQSAINITFRKHNSGVPRRRCLAELLPVTLAYLHAGPNVSPSQVSNAMLPGLGAGGQVGDYGARRAKLKPSGARPSRHETSTDSI